MANIIQTEQSLTRELLERQPSRLWFVNFCAALFIVCILLSATPIARIEQLHINDTPKFYPPAMQFLTSWGMLLPLDLRLASQHNASLYSTSDLEFLLLMLLAFIVYIALALFLKCHAQVAQTKYCRRLIWLGVILAGLIFVLTPGTLSNDLFTYADYGNLVGAHRANPYFTTPAQSAPADLLTQIDGWRYVPSAYGPVWIYVCGLFSLIFGSNPVSYFYAYRLLALACHLLNTLLIGRMLSKTGRSAHIRTLGIFLYAWNPLALFESSLGAHNDVFMSSFLLLGLLLCLRAEQKDFTQLNNYWPGLVALTLATLVKFTALPLIVFFLLLLAVRSLSTSPHTSTTLRTMQWRRALINVLIASCIFGLLSLLLYAPFWLGHDIGSIIRSFAAPPSSTGSENSLMRVAAEWAKVLHTSPGSALAFFIRILASRNFWSKVGGIAMVAILLPATWYMWKQPGIRSMVTGSLTTLAVLLLVTPWFFSWYVVWLVALAPLLLAFPLKQATKSLLVFCLVFSASSLATYIDFHLLTDFTDYQLGIRYLLTFAPPMGAAAFIYFRSLR